MLIRLIRDDLGVAQGFDTEDRAGDIVRIDCEPFWKPGTIINEASPRAVKLLVDNGDAEPADAEAEAVCAGWRLRRDEVLLAREMLAKAIEPEDRERFRRGELLGYDADGNDIPGPAAKREESWLGRL